MDEQTVKSDGYAFVTVSTHISEELMKLNGLEFRYSFSQNKKCCYLLRQYGI